MMPVSRGHAVAELQRRGIVPHECVDGFGYHHDPHFERGDGKTSAWVWHEPIPGPYTKGLTRYDGLHTHSGKGIPHYRHGGSMVEVHRRKGVEWRLTRVLFSHPYKSAAQMRATVGEVRRRLALDLAVVEDLPWLNTGHALCVYTPSEPVAFRDFCRTFRFWVVSNLQPTPGYRSFRLRDGVLPRGVAPPDDVFFDLAHCADRASVVLGLRGETAVDAWNALRHLRKWIEYDTFVFLWTAYRAAVHAVPILFAVLFVAKLRARVADRAAHAPGGAAYERLRTEWAAMW